MNLTLHRTRRRLDSPALVRFCTLSGSLQLLIAFVLAASAHGVEIEKNVAVQMRDGVVLRADVYRPDEAGSYPVLVLRTPYNKDGGKMDAYVNAGYIVVKQDARGRFASDGKWESLYHFDTHDAQDGVAHGGHRLSRSRPARLVHRGGH